ncbi:hypothetical protein SPHINGO391_280004 [Sphingomonas aurantiaca]|uniref:Uncharacterized protein n=1 Tax=Sphingomonas aurantiaca TaxID=185949 RepID=A0A5E7XWQ1_9SPHN|nr:hypothetical protein SPHINGO391_280004 [Sphingomonas aurantiaca]
MPNASDDLPEPDMPVNTTKASRGTSTSIFLRLFWRAPRTCTQAGGPACPWSEACVVECISLFFNLVFLPYPPVRPVFHHNQGNR